MKRNPENKKLERKEILREARRIFVDSENYGPEILVGCYRLIKELFAYNELADNSATILGLERIRMELEEYYEKVIFYRYYLGLTYNDIARNIPLTCEKIRKIDGKCLQLIYRRSKEFFLPQKFKFLTRYAIFIESIQTGIPSKEDIPIHELSLSTHITSALLRGNIFTASQMFLLTNDELLKLHGVGPRTLDEITIVKKNLLIGEF